MPSSILFVSINVNSFDTQSMVLVGENSQNSWDSHSKNDLGSGLLFGFFTSAGNMFFVNDTSIINTPINDQDFKPVAEIQA